MITVMFSSRNGALRIGRVLDAFSRLKAPAGGWKLVAVDNGSTDGTADVMRSYGDRLPISVLSESAPGKNRALNRALADAKGDFYVFTDDDIVVEPDWLIRWRETADTHPDFALFAGASRALWPHEPPPGLLKGVNLNVVYASHVGINEGPCSAACMYGTNMAVRASAFGRDVRFSEAIGPDGSANYAMGSDTELALRLEASGLKCWFANAPFVQHIVRAEQMDPEWILRRGYRWGRGLAKMRLPYADTPAQLARKNDLKRVIYPVVLPFLSPEHRWRRKWHYAVDQGYEDGSREISGKKQRWS